MHKGFLTPESEINARWQLRQQKYSEDDDMGNLQFEVQEPKSEKFRAKTNLGRPSLFQTKKIPELQLSFALLPRDIPRPVLSVLSYPVLRPPALQVRTC